MKNLSFRQVNLTNGFWKTRRDTDAQTTIYSVYDRFKDTGRIDAFDFKWKKGEPFMPHVFWDSDVAKWLESAAELLAFYKDENLLRMGREIIDKIEAHQENNGYFNIHFTVVEPENRFKNRDLHELYCAGHLMEAAVAWYQSTGEDKLLRCMEKYADLICKKFVDAQTEGFATPGHEEIELALVKLYETTGKEKYLRMAGTFIDNRGRHLLNEDDRHGLYATKQQVQSHIPVREQKEAVGHAVRAMYLYCAMADLALRLRDESLKQACITLFESVCKRMYITGGIGATASGEAFSVDYDLPNATAYSETCAAIGLCFFAQRMQALDPAGKYGDVLERAAYNGVLSGISLDGKAFFYENPLEIPPREIRDKNIRYPITKRLEVFDCSCCPPNITRFLAAFGDNIYTLDGNTLFLWQFAANETDVEFERGKGHISLQTDYPVSGRLRIDYTGVEATLKVRIPAWCVAYKGKTENGLATFPIRDGETTVIDLPMEPVYISADPRVICDAGRVAVQRGPVVYCMEEEDNGAFLRDVTLGSLSDAKEILEPAYGVPVLEIPAVRHGLFENGRIYQPADKRENLPFTARLIPYFAFANREKSEMLVWLNQR